MLGSKTLSRGVFFGLGYLAGTRAGRERFDQIEAGLQAVVECFGFRPTASPRRSRIVFLPKSLFMNTPVVLW